MESRKAGYSEITRLRVKNPNHIPELPESAANREYFNVTESQAINNELHSTFNSIYKHQPNLDTSQDALSNYLILLHKKNLTKESYPTKSQTGWRDSSQKQN